MKRIIIISLVFLSFLSSNSFAQKTTYDYPRRYGNTFNAGLGMGYFNYIGHSVPVIMVNYEFDVARNFTLAPFVGYYSYSDYTVYQGYEYYYHETIIPLGLKGSYYFDELFHAAHDGISTLQLPLDLTYTAKPGTMVTTETEVLPANPAHCMAIFMLVRVIISHTIRVCSLICPAEFRPLGYHSECIRTYRIKVKIPS